MTFSDRSSARSDRSSPRSPERIETIDDPRVADYRVVRDGELLRERGLFVVEGRANLERLVRESRHRPLSLFLCDPAAEAMGALLSEVDTDVAVYVATRQLLSRIAGFDVHRGCLALCARGVMPSPEALFAPPDAPSVLVVLEGLSDPDNVGAVFRNALAFGVDAVLLSPRCCDPLYRKAVRVSMGASLCVPTARFAKWPEGLSQVRAAGYRVVAFHPSTDAEPLRAANALPARAALVFGTEGNGLSAEALTLSDERRRIDMLPGVDSLNVATATGIALFEAFRARATGSLS